MDALGIEILRTNNDEVIARCPVHMERTGSEDRHPSWSVNRISGLHNCYSCGFAGTFLDLVQELGPGMRFDVFAAQRWIRTFGVSQEVNLRLGEKRERRAPSVFKEEYRQPMVPETRLAMFDHAPDWALAERMLKRESVDHYGIRWDATDEAWIIPVRQGDGTLAGWQRKWTKHRRFMNEPDDMVKSVCLFGWDRIVDGEPVVLVESPLDVVRMHSAGYHNTVASFGAEVSVVQVEMILARTNEIILALDNDEAGWLHAGEVAFGKLDGGRRVTAGYAKRFKTLLFFFYPPKAPKDVGGMEESLIEYGLYNAEHSTVAQRRYPDVKERTLRDVQRKAAPVPGRARRSNGRPRAVPAAGRGWLPSRRDPGHHQPKR
jgi:hypothetical protein